jgi:hypothetical protein
MADHDNTNRGAIWKNEKKEKDTHPDFKGSVNVDGREYWVSAWKRKEGAGPKSPALSFSVKPKDDQPQQSISQRATPKGPARGPQRQNILSDDDMDGDRIPF